MQPDQKEKKARAVPGREEFLPKPSLSMTDMFQVVELIYDNDGNPIDYILREVNPVIERILDRKKVEITGRRAKEIFGTVENFWIEVFALVDKTGNPVRFRHFSVIFSKWFEIYSWKSGQKYVGAIITDISEKRRLEEKLENEEQRSRSGHQLANARLKEIENLYNTIPIGLCVFDTSLRFIRINEKMAEMNGIPAKDHIGKKADEILPELAEKVRSTLSKVLETGEPQLGVILKGKTPAQPGIERSWSEDWVPVRNDRGEIVAINVAVLEITAERKAKERLIKSEIKLRAAKKALEKSEQKLKMLLENGRIGIWERDLSNDKITWDARSEQIFGFKPGTFDNSLATFKNCICEEDILNLEGVVNKSIRSGLPYEVVYRTKPADGESNYIAEKGFIIRDEKGNPQKTMGICFDVSEMKKGAEQVIMKMNEELLRSNRELQQFAYVASHDLQEPLRMVSSFSQLLAMKYDDKLDEDAREYIKYAVDGSKRMYDLLNALLAYSRVQTRGREFLSIDMNKVVEKVKANLHLLLEKTQASIEFDNLGVINADENQMVQLIQNLIENSIKFNKGQPHIKITSEAADGCRIFSVSDDGIGIEEKYYERIFRIFQRLHTSKDYPGTGIGLAICQRIVERHNGIIWVESKPGQGSVFHFSIPQYTA
ncbi:MAG TPA: ATP-binding protein [Bacteroidales bacterium]|nr:ATP-binding protein [Bacteroidales bacterium]